MSDLPSGPTDPTPTVRFDAPPAVPTIGPATGTSPVPAPTPPPSGPAESSRRGGRDEPGRTGTIVFGLIVIAVGLWFFADQTLGLEMPRLRWGELWPVILIVIGGWILLSSIRRRR